MPPYFSFACYTFDDEKISTLHFNPTDIALYGGIVLEWCSGSRETQLLIIFSPPHYPLLGPTGVNPCSDLGSAFVLRSAAAACWAGLACCDVGRNWSFEASCAWCWATVHTSSSWWMMETPPPRPGTTQLQPGGRGVVGDDEAENVAD